MPSVKVIRKAAGPYPMMLAMDLESFLFLLFHLPACDQRLGAFRLVKCKVLGDR